MKQRYKEALSQVDYILNNFNKEDLDKIPHNFKEFIYSNKCKWYEINEDENLYEESLSILALIYRKFLSPVEEREELEIRYLEKLNQEELNNIINNQIINSNTEINYNFVQPKYNKNTEQTLESNILIKYKKERWYKKLLSKLKSIFRNV